MRNRHESRLAPAILALAVFFPVSAAAQGETGTIAGTVKDATGGVLPGMTVEAASPALIEKVRTVTTDGDGRYQIVNLRPGTYTVTFELPGFNTVRREGIELSAGVHRHRQRRPARRRGRGDDHGDRRVADRRRQERDVQQKTMSRDVIDSLPTAKTFGSLAALDPGGDGQPSRRRRLLRRSQHVADDPRQPHERQPDHDGRHVGRQRPGRAAATVTSSTTGWCRRSASRPAACRRSTTRPACDRT